LRPLSCPSVAPPRSFRQDVNRAGTDRGILHSNRRSAIQKVRRESRLVKELIVDHRSRITDNGLAILPHLLPCRIGSGLRLVFMLESPALLFFHTVGNHDDVSLTPASLAVTLTVLPSVSLLPVAPFILLPFLACACAKTRASAGRSPSRNKPSRTTRFVRSAE